MSHSLRLDRRAFLKGLGGVALALPVLDAMGAEVTDQIPRRFCAIYTANGMSLPKTEHGIDDWSWFPTTGVNGEIQFGKSTEPYKPFAKKISFLGGLHHPNGPKADPHTCSDMWLTGAPLQNPKPGTYNTAGLDQVIAQHTKQFCRQPSLVLSIDAGTGYLSRTGTISYNLDGRPSPPRTIPAESSTASSAPTIPPSKRSTKSYNAALSSSTPSPKAPRPWIHNSAKPTATAWTST